jgi:hypothetical protein
MRMELSIRFDYGAIVPWVRHAQKGIWAIAGPDAQKMCKWPGQPINESGG